MPPYNFANGIIEGVHCAGLRTLTTLAREMAPFGRVSEANWRLAWNEACAVIFHLMRAAAVCFYRGARGGEYLIN
jgi:hypothetical protein